VIAGREPADVADVAEHRGGDDGPDAVDVGHGRGRGRNGVAGTAFNLAPLLVDALQILDQVTASSTRARAAQPSAVMPARTWLCRGCGRAEC
jgi:hypothetical protein